MSIWTLNPAHSLTRQKKVTADHTHKRALTQDKHNKKNSKKAQI